MTKLFDDLFGSPFLKGDDLPDGGIVATIKDFEATSMGQNDERKMVLKFRELDKDLVLNKTNGRKLGELFGHDPDAWINRKVMLFPTWVDFRGEEVLTVRIREAKPRQPVQVPEVPEYTDDDYQDEEPAAY